MKQTYSKYTCTTCALSLLYRVNRVLDSDRQALEQESCFSQISRRLSQASSVFRFGPGTPGHWHSWGQVFLVLQEKVVVRFLYDSSGLSGTGTGDGTLLQVDVPQSVYHCHIPSGFAHGVL